MEKIIKKGEVFTEKHTIKGKIVQRKAYINENGVLVDEWDIPADLEDVPTEEIVKKFKKVIRK